MFSEPVQQANGKRRLSKPLAACFACTALVIFSLSFRPPVSTNCLLGSLGLCFLLVCSLLAGLGPLLAALGPLLGALGPLLAALGLLLGRSWALLGGSWEALGRLLAALGRSWGDLGKTSKNQSKNDAQHDRFWLPKGRPKGVKIEPQTDQNRRQKSMRTKHLFKIVLRPFWSDLGSFLVASWGHFC